MSTSVPLLAGGPIERSEIEGGARTPDAAERDSRRRFVSIRLQPRPDEPARSKRSACRGSSRTPLARPTAVRSPRKRGDRAAYTIGLFGLAHPELLIVGAGQETSAGVLNDLGARVRGGSALLPGQLITFENWPHRIIPEVVPNPGEILFSANTYYQRPDEYSVPALQLSYDDKKGRFPWEPGYSNPELQPRPGSFAA